MKWMKEWMNEINKRMTWHEWLEWIDEWVETNALTWMNEWMNGWMDGWKEWMNDWMTWNKRTEMNELRWMNWKEWIDMKDLKWMNWSQWIEVNEFKSMSWNEWIEMNELRWMTWDEWLDKSGPKTLVFYVFLCEIKLSLQSRAPFADLIFHKCSGPRSFLQFYVISYLLMMWLTYEIELSLHLLPASSSKSAPRLTVFLRFLCKIVHMLSTTFPDRAAKPWKQRPSFGDHGSHFTRKNTGFCAQECFQAWIHALPISHTSQLLAWWCGWHDDWGDDVVAIMVRKLAMTIVCNSEVS